MEIIEGSYMAIHSPEIYINGWDIYIKSGKGVKSPKGIWVFMQWMSVKNAQKLFTKELPVF
jgi:hypothetical protein